MVRRRVRMPSSFAHRAGAREADGGIDVRRLDRQAALQPLVEAGEGLVGGGDIVRFAGDLELVGAGAQLHFGELLDAREVAVVDAIELDQHRIVFERERGGYAHAATS